MLANVTFCLAVSTNFEGPGGIYKPVVNFAILLTRSDLCRLPEVMSEPRVRQGYGIFYSGVCVPKTSSISLGTILLRSLCFQKHLCLHRFPLINNTMRCALIRWREKNSSKLVLHPRNEPFSHSQTQHHSKHCRITESQNILSCKGPIGIIKSNSWLQNQLCPSRNQNMV